VFSIFLVLNHNFSKASSIANSIFDAAVVFHGQFADEVMFEVARVVPQIARFAAHDAAGLALVVVRVGFDVKRVSVPKTFVHFRPVVPRKVADRHVRSGNPEIP